MKKLTFLVLIVFFNNHYLFANSPGYKINELINAYAENGQFNGAILVKKGETVLYKKAFGYANREWNIPNTTDSKFIIGSISKPITALMTLILVNDGVLDLNSTINDYIPGYSGPAKNKATIHQLLTHTSGIPHYGAIQNLSKKRIRWIYNPDEYLQLINEIEAEFKPGSRFMYSGIGYNILAIICEKATKKDFADLLKERIFMPLNMKDTKLDRNLDIDTKRADGYEYHLLEGYMHPSYVEMCHVIGSGGILTTVEDMAKFNNECFKTQTLLSKDLYKKMFTRHAKDWQHYGYGWWITDRNIGGDRLTLISHGGSMDGYKAYLTRIVQDSIDIIICQNNYYRTELGRKFNHDITNEIIDILYGKEYSLPKKAVAKDLGFTIGRKGIKAAVEKFQILKEKPGYFTNENELNVLARELYKNYGLKKEAFEIYELAINEYPNSFRLNYSYGEILAENKNKRAIDYFKRCVQLYEKNSENKKFRKEYHKALKRVKEKN